MGLGTEMMRMAVVGTACGVVVGKSWLGWARGLDLGLGEVRMQEGVGVVEGKSVLQWAEAGAVVGKESAEEDRLHAYTHSNTQDKVSRGLFVWERLDVRSEARGSVARGKTGILLYVPQAHGALELH